MFARLKEMLSGASNGGASAEVTPSQPRKQPENSNAPADYEIKPGTSYTLVELGRVVKRDTSDPEELALECSRSCPLCGAEYPGPVGNACLYCFRRTREKYLKPKKEPVRDDLVQEPKVATLPAADGSAKKWEGAQTIGDNVSLDRLSTKIIITGKGFKANGIQAARLNLGPGSSVGYILIADDGEVIIGQGSHVNHLSVGRHARVTLEEGVDLNRLAKIDDGEIELNIASGASIKENIEVWSGNFREWWDNF